MLIQYSVEVALELTDLLAGHAVTINEHQRPRQPICARRGRHRQRGEVEAFEPSQPGPNLAVRSEPITDFGGQLDAPRACAARTAQPTSDSTDDAATGPTIRSRGKRIGSSARILASTSSGM